MNELHEQFEPAGLSIVGVTGESAEKTEPWVEEHGMAYAFGYLKKEALNELMTQCGMRGYPSAVLVDPKGEVVWAGHPSSVDDNLIEKHLKGADKTPVDVRAVVRRWPKEARQIRAAYAKGQLAKALDEASKLSDGAAIVSDIERAIGRRSERLRAMHSAGDFLGFVEAMKDSAKDLSGLPVAAELDALLKEVNTDAAAKAVMTGQKKLRRLCDAAAELRKAKDIDVLEKKVRKLALEHPQTYVEASANKLLQQLEKKRKKR